MNWTKKGNSLIRNGGNFKAKFIIKIYLYVLVHLPHSEALQLDWMFLGSDQIVQMFSRKWAFHTNDAQVPLTQYIAE
jgi:hypothetical protein